MLQWANKVTELVDTTFQEKVEACKSIWNML